MATIFKGLKSFIDDMGKTHLPIAVWASLFPFPQFLIGGYLSATRGFATPAGYMLVSRAISFIVAGQVNLRRPLSKLIGPIMHVPFLIAVPLCFQWLRSQAPAADPHMHRFIAYTTAITTFSLVMDFITAAKYLLTGRDPGKYTTKRPGTPSHRWVLPIPSLLMFAYAYYTSGGWP
mmetsp:Transcript_12898/g.30002  ORF Transcript_12898/g.30002 Transcript_12898/m.30002 type:complete len:176 (+) Transcript_12898:99-626(+)